MMFRHLRLAGFKSFADTAELDIEPGLTGIVGPNGCGKSNIVEALRWVMGETSAKQMRSNEMDDVIFSGTSSKAARNLAEISLILDNEQKKAPSEYNDRDEIEIARKIIRGKGTNYRINNTPARARDVQLLFADSATGARSAGIVSQGRIGAIIDAKPDERRTLLEEAASIKGLHQRKHEAELRLNNAELNITRIVELMAQLEEQRISLQKQARQAARYRSVAERIRKAEASLLHVLWISANSELYRAEIALKQAQDSVSKAQLNVNSSSKKRLEIAEKLPELRSSEASLAAKTQLLSANLSQIERDETRIEDEILRLQAQCAQIDKDSQREEALQKDALEAKNKLIEEIKKLEKTEKENAPMLIKAKEKLEEARLKNQLADEKSAEANAVLQNLEQHQSELKNQIFQKQTIITQSLEKLNEINLNELETLTSEQKKKFNKLDTEITKTNQQIEQQSKNLENLKTQRDNAFELSQAALNQVRRLETERDALGDLIKSDISSGQSPISDSISVIGDMESALAAYLTEDLYLPLGSGKDGYWQAKMLPLQSLNPPSIGTPLKDFIKGPDTIMRAIQGVSIISDDAMKSDIYTKLELGQAVVTKSGKLARWDGLVRLIKDTGATRIRQIQRIKELDILILDAQSDENKKNIKLEQLESLVSSENLKFEQLQEVRQHLSQEIIKTQRDVDTSEISFKTASDRYLSLKQLIKEAENELNDFNSKMSKIDDISKLKKTADSATENASKSRAYYDQCVQQEAEIRQTLQSILSRKEFVLTQEDEWKGRLDGTKKRMQEMKVRAQKSLEELSILKAKPNQLKEERGKLTTLLATTKQKHDQSVILVKETDIILQQADNQQRLDEKHLAETREAQIRQESVETQAKKMIDSLKNQIVEKLSISPNKLFDITSISEKENLPEVQQLEARINKLLRERDHLGPVNLRAEIEMEEIQEKLAKFEVDKNDLEQAIAKLRRAISELNKEARHRLLDSLTKVNAEFSELFKTLFGGGKAELKLINSDDPLTAGLEIFASPPGKKLQSLSLLSGGEQALTGLAIIFSVFLTNPSPICILDEVDAPLDDSNVSRFCELLRHIVTRTQTNFLIVTHHRMTMSQMDRLYGVTMAEPGVSKLVSVDLQTAETLREDE